MTPTLTAAGPAYAADVFVKPSVAKKQLAVEVTVANPSAAEAAGEVQLRSRGRRKTGPGREDAAAEVRSPSPAGEAQTIEVSGDVGRPEALVARRPAPVRAAHDGHASTARPSTSPTRPSASASGAMRGKDFTLNGVPWHGWNMARQRHRPRRVARLLPQDEPDVDAPVRGHAGRDRPFFGMSPDEALDWFDTPRRRRPPLRHPRRRGDRLHGHRERPRPARSCTTPTIKMDLMRQLARPDGRPGEGRAQPPVAS